MRHEEEHLSKQTIDNLMLPSQAICHSSKIQNLVISVSAADKPYYIYYLTFKNIMMGKITVKLRAWTHFSDKC